MREFADKALEISAADDSAVGGYETVVETGLLRDIAFPSWCAKMCFYFFGLRLTRTTALVLAWRREDSIKDQSRIGSACREIRYGEALETNVGVGRRGLCATLTSICAAPLDSRLAALLQRAHLSPWLGFATPCSGSSGQFSLASRTSGDGGLAPYE